MPLTLQMKQRSSIVDLSGVGLFVIEEFVPFLRWMDLGGSERQLKRLHAEFDRFFINVLKEHRSKVKKATDRQDFVDVLLELQKDEHLALTDDRIKAFLQDLLLAGVDTGSGQALWILAELMRHPEVMRKLQTEIDSVVGKDRLFVESDLIHCAYLKAVIKESFRLHPVVPLLVPHESVRATTIAGYDIPAKTRLFVNVSAIGRDAQTWDNPLEFNPDRFLNRSTELGGQSFELIPFGSGRRLCVGINLGLLLVESTVASWVHALDFYLPPEVKPADVDCEEAFGVTACKKNPLHVQAKKRLAAQAYKELDLFL